MIRSPASLILCLILMVLATFSAPRAAAQSQNPNVGHIVQELDRLNQDIWTAEATIRNNRHTLQRISAFSATARSWFQHQDSLKQQMRQAQINGDQSLYAAFQGQLDALADLDGRVLEAWDGTQVDSLEALRAKFVESSHLLPGLVRECAAAQAELKRLTPQRDQYAAQYGQYAEDMTFQIKMLDSEYQILKEDYQYLSDMAGNPDIWLLSGPNSILAPKPLYAHRGLIMELITQDVMKECLASGRPFDSNVLAQRIKNAQAASNAAKNEITSVRLPEIRERLQEIEQEVAAIKSGGELAGCWVLDLGSTQARFQINEVQPGMFEATIASDTLKNYSPGDLAFRVSPVKGSPGVYKGTEYGYDQNDGYREWPLTIRLYQNSLAYSSDVNISMTRCP